MANQNVIEKWLTALESGEYEQTPGRLRKRYPSGSVGYCCLGVLCDLAVKEGVIPEPTDQRQGNDVRVAWYGTDNHSSDLCLPRVVRDWAGLTEEDPYVEFLIEYEDEDEIRMQEDTLATLNDSGKTFAEISQIIRDNFLSDGE